MTDPVASYREAVMLTQHATKASVTVEIPAPGLFLVDAKLVSAQGGVLASGRINVAAIPPAQHAGLPDFGVVTHFGQNSGSPALVLPLVKLAGFTWIRDELPWDQVEKEPGHFSFPAYMDACVNAASKLGIGLLVLLDYGNPDAYPGRFTGAQGFPRTPEERVLFVHYVEQVVGRYGKTVKHWELWNEPAFSDIKYSDYVALLKTVYGSIKTKSPDATVISCGGGGAGGGPGGDCIDSIVSSGALEYQDGFSVHPYMSPHVPETGYQAKDAPIDAVNIPTAWPFLNELIAQHPGSGGRRLQLWITELGWSSSPASEGLSELAQAATWSAATCFQDATPRSKSCSGMTLSMTAATLFRVSTILDWYERTFRRNPLSSPPR